MKIELSFQDIRQTFVGRDADDILHQAKAEAARRAPFLVKAVINRMSDLDFAGEVVKRANQAEKRSDPPPQNARMFLDWAVRYGYVRILEP
jgi:hypothetical protein